MELGYSASFNIHGRDHGRRAVKVRSYRANGLFEAGYSYLFNSKLDAEFASTALRAHRPEAGIFSRCRHRRHGDCD